MTTNPLSPVKPVESAEPALVKRPRERPSNEEIAAWVLTAAMLLFVFYTHLVAALIGGLALYLILDRLALWFSRHMPHAAARPLALLMVTLVGGGVIIGAITLAVAYLRHHVDRIPAMMTQMAEILRTTRLWLGGYGHELIPDVMTDAENIKGAIIDWLKQHALGLKTAGGTLSAGVLRIVMGMLLAIVVFFRHVTHHDDKLRGPLAAYLADKVDRFAHAFSRIAAAQIKVSALNTLIIAIYLLTWMLFGKGIPFTTTLIVLTFICGLLPILGNIVSNAVLVILSLGVSGGVAVASLVFVVALSKLQYVLTSRILGGEIDSQAWEILLAIILGETAFGIPGVIMAPIVYAFAKRELRERGLV